MNQVKQQRNSRARSATQVVLLSPAHLGLLEAEVGLGYWEEGGGLIRTQCETPGVTARLSDGPVAWESHLYLSDLALNLQC